MVRITVGLDDETLEQLMDQFQTDNKSQAVREAVSKFLREHQKAQLKSLRGKLSLEENWDDLRSLETDE